MSNSSCRDALRGRAAAGNSTNAGLVLSCYLESAEDPQKKLQVLGAAATAARNTKALYAKAYQRWTRSLDQDPCCLRQEVSTASAARVIVGLGNSSVLEASIALQHTYGVPVLPGSALKGLTAHYCDQAYGARNAGFKSAGGGCASANGPNSHTEGAAGAYHQLLFGTKESAGHVIFHDAWLLPGILDSKLGVLRTDVMTPHHGGYYGGAAAPGRTIPAPTDFDDPVPVPFLSVGGTFLLALSCDAEPSKGLPWVELAMTMLCEALESWGIGAKTSSGYGRLSSNGGAVEPADPGPRYRRGEGPIRAVRIVDDKGRTKYEADDGCLGHVPGDDPPGQEGDEYQVWVVQCASHGYEFSFEQPRAKQISRKKRSGGRRK